MAKMSVSMAMHTDWTQNTQFTSTEVYVDDDRNTEQHVVNSQHSRHVIIFQHVEVKEDG